MKIISTTDGKYMGHEIPSNIQPGDTIALGDYEFQVQYVHHLENGNYAVGNANYQLQCEE